MHLKGWRIFNENDCCRPWTKNPFKNLCSRQVRIINTLTLACIARTLSRIYLICVCQMFNLLILPVYMHTKVNVPTCICLSSRNKPLVRNMTVWVSFWLFLYFLPFLFLYFFSLFCSSVWFLFEQCFVWRHLGSISRKPRKLFGPVKPFSVHQYLKKKKCIPLKLLVWRELLFILKICE